MTYTVFPSVISFRQIPNFIWPDGVPTDNLPGILKVRVGYSIFTMFLFYGGVWTGFATVYYRRKKEISIMNSAIITGVRTLCTILILIDSVLDRQGIASFSFESFNVVLLGLTHSTMVYYHLASKPNLKDVTLQYQDMAGTIRTLSQMLGMVTGITLQAIMLKTFIEKHMTDA